MRNAGNLDSSLHFWHTVARPARKDAFVRKRTRKSVELVGASFAQSTFTVLYSQILAWASLRARDDASGAFRLFLLCDPRTRPVLAAAGPRHIVASADNPIRHPQREPAADAEIQRATIGCARVCSSSADLAAAATTNTTTTTITTTTITTVLISWEAPTFAAL